MAIESSIYATGMITVGLVWYQQFDLKQWHWFDDKNEWYQIDKLGHAFSTYQGAYLSHKIHRHYGFEKKQSILWSSVSSFVAISSIEIFDGFAVDWGASLTDISANAIGALLFASQEYFFDKQMMRLKFSYHPTPLPKYRPELLGSTPLEKILKDYNAQQYWLSINLHDLFSLNSFPRWLNIAAGYGGYNILSANTSQIIVPELKPYRRFFLSFDIDWSKIKTRHQWLNAFLEAINVVKFPFPTIEFNPYGTKGYWIF
ncbi:MAG TPA: DUF2279 domain-containing protein [Salinivirgaceae bacterium]|nr:DUF2279 domain-containing protein [Salinivirgaceae bacterium]